MKFALKNFAANAEQVDRESPQLVDGHVQLSSSANKSMNTAKEFGVAGVSISPEFGGMGAPMLLEMASVEMINRACPSTMLNIAWYGPVAHVIDNFASEELKRKYIPEIAAGNISGNMALTEADTGSDLSKIRTYGEEQADGSWKLFDPNVLFQMGK